MRAFFSKPTMNARPRQADQGIAAKPSAGVRKHASGSSSPCNPRENPLASQATHWLPTQPGLQRCWVRQTAQQPPVTAHESLAMACAFKQSRLAARRLLPAQKLRCTLFTVSAPGPSRGPGRAGARLRMPHASANHVADRGSAVAWTGAADAASRALAARQIYFRATASKVRSAG